WRDVDRETQAFGLATPGGLVSDTGVAGLTPLGGIGWLRSRHGLSLDQLLRAALMTADPPPVHSSWQRNFHPLLGLTGRRRQFRGRYEFRICASPGRAPGDVLCTALPDRVGGPCHSVLAQFPRRQKRGSRIACRVLDYPREPRLPQGGLATASCRTCSR